MKCPYCQKEMQCGYLYTGRGDLCWTPEEESPNFFVNRWKENQVGLAKQHLLSGSKVKTYRCVDCKIELIDEKDLSLTRAHQKAWEQKEKE